MHAGVRLHDRDVHGASRGLSDLKREAMTVKRVRARGVVRVERERERMNVSCVHSKAFTALRERKPKKIESSSEGAKQVLYAGPGAWTAGLRKFSQRAMELAESRRSMDFHRPIWDTLK